MTAPAPGDVFYVGAGCGVPHGFRPIRFRVISVDARPTYDGMTWLDGYELDHTGRAVERRRIYVITAGLQHLQRPAEKATAPVRRPTNAGPARPRIPRPRTSSETTTGRTR